MFRIAILGCENSHANQFLNFVIKEKLFDDVEVVGVYSNEPEAMERLKEEYGVNTASSYDEFVGKVDGIVVTARHGDNHYKYAKPYIESGIPMFIDKPITISGEEGIEFMKELKAHSVKVTGGSCCIYEPFVKSLKNIVENKTLGKVMGGFLRAPNVNNSPYGGFYFYSQHLVQIMTEIFGKYPVSVSSFEKDDTITTVVRYPDFDVTTVLVDDNFKYYGAVNCADAVQGGMFSVGFENFLSEFTHFVEVLRGNAEGEDYIDFISPVFILNAMERSMKNGGREEKINYMQQI